MVSNIRYNSVDQRPHNLVTAAEKGHQSIEHITGIFDILMGHDHMTSEDVRDGKKHDCPKAHGLQTFDTDDPEYECNRCTKNQPIGIKMYGCRTCDFDLCNHCWNKSGKQELKEQKEQRKVDKKLAFIERKMKGFYHEKKSKKSKLKKKNFFNKTIIKNKPMKNQRNLRRKGSINQANFGGQNH